MIKSNKCQAVILLGHGSRDSFDRFTAKELGNIPAAEFVWIYACECGLGLIHKLALRYSKVLGYATTVLAPSTSKSTVAHMIKKIIESWKGDLDGDGVVKKVQSRLLLDALGFLKKAQTKGAENGYWLVVAAVFNHTRLSLRAGVPEHSSAN